MQTLLLIIYLAVAAFILGGFLFMEGMESRTKRNGFRNDDITGFFFLAALWPLVVFFVVVSAPFYGLWKLGVYIGDLRGDKRVE